MKPMLNNILQKLLENSNKYMEEKKRNWQFLTTITATILGFSLGIINILEVESSLLLKFSWAFQMITILIGAVLLILEAESRNYRENLALEAQLKMKENEHSDEEMKRIFKSYIDKVYGKVSEKEIKYRIFQWFNKHSYEMEFSFYIFLLVYFFLLFFSLFI